MDSSRLSARPRWRKTRPDRDPRTKLTAQGKAGVYALRGKRCRKCTRPLHAGDAWDVERISIDGDRQTLDVLCSWCRAEAQPPQPLVAETAKAKHALSGAQRISRTPFAGWQSFAGKPVWNPKRRR